MSTLREKLLKNSTSSYTDVLVDSKIYNEKDIIPLNVPMMNVALSARLDGGMTPGLTMIAGASKHFKSGFTLLLAAAFLHKYDDGIILFYDSEFGTPESYFDQFEIDRERVVHTPITNIEQLKFDIVNQLENIERGDKLMIIVDSVGNLASKKEVEDAKEQKTVADMTRAKQLKSLGRIITPHLTLKNIPMVVVNHTYKEMSMFPKEIVGGGTGLYLSADNIWILGRQQEKDKDKEIVGWNFIINIEKSRYVKEKSKIPISITYEGGINKWSGLFDVAFEAGMIREVKKGKYVLINETGEILSEEYKKIDLIDNNDFWSKVIVDPLFKEYIKNTYSMESSTIKKTDEVE